VVRAVIFDWGGTLTTYVHVEPAAVWISAAQCLVPGEPDVMCRLLESVEQDLWASVRTEARSSSVVSLIRMAADRIGLALTEGQVAEAARCYLNAWTPHVVHRPDAAAALRALRERDIRVGLLSNTLWPASFHDELLARDGLADLIDVRHYTSESSWMKPHPEAFAAVLRRLGIDEPASAAFVGDCMYDDIFGAKRAGLRTVYLTNDQLPAYDVEPDATIDTLADLVDVIDRWAA
jgi:putative hydrolase of the HAD superfamily